MSEKPNHENDSEDKPSSSEDWKDYPPLPKPHQWREENDPKSQKLPISKPDPRLSETRPSIRDPRFPRKKSPEAVEKTHRITPPNNLPPLRKPGSRPEKAEPSDDKPENGKPGKKTFWGIVLAALAFILALAGVVAVSAYIGWGQGEQERLALATSQSEEYILNQLDLAHEDMTNGDYDRARQRYEFVIENDPDNEAALAGLASVRIVMDITASPTPFIPTSTPTLTPTPDLRPVMEMFASAEEQFTSEQWTRTIEILLTVRQSDPNYKTAEIDGMIYASLRNRGVERILYLGELEEGLYDLTLAENFGPLDTDSIAYQSWARLYQLGNAFWYAYPESAAFYYGQLMAAAPNLTDSSGMTAFYRYWMSLVHIADQTAKTEDWCTASANYETAMNARPDSIIQATQAFVNQKCLDLTPSATPTATITLTPTVTLLISPTVDLTVESTLTPTYTPTPTLTAPAETVPSTPSPTSTATETEMAVETQTQTPTATQTATNTEIPLPTQTFTPTPTTEAVPTEDTSGEGDS